MTKVVNLDTVRDVATLTDEPQPAEHTWQPHSLIALAANPPEPPTIGGLLYPGKRTVLSGETESMKTWFALILAKAELDAGYPVGWVDLDAMGAGAMLERLQLLGVDKDTIDRDFHYIEPSEQLGPKQIADTVDLITDKQIRLFVIDAFNPILNLHGLDPNSVTDVETFWRTIADPICRAGAAPVLLDHVVKNPEARGKYASGSERKASGAIVHLGFKLLEPLTKGGRGRTLLNVHKDRPGYLPRPALGRLILTATGDQIVYTLEPDQSHDDEGRFRPTVLMEKVSVYLELHAGAASTNEIEKSVTGNGKAIRTAIQTLVDDGYARQEQGPRRAILYTSIRPYRQTDDTPKPTSSPLRPDFVLDLRSRPTSSSSPPLTGTRSVEDPQDDLVLTSSSSNRDDGDPIPEYDHPPIDETLQPYDDEPTTPTDSWLT